MKNEVSKKNEELVVTNQKVVLKGNDVEPSMKFAVAIGAEILKTEVEGFFKKENKMTEILILPKTVKESKGMNLDEMLKAVNKQFGADTDKIKRAIENIAPNIKLKDLNFRLNQIFFYMQKEEGKTEGEEKGVDIKEYAFSITIGFVGTLNLADIIEVKALNLAVWNTKRKPVLKQLNMADISQLLPSESENE